MSRRTDLHLILQPKQGYLPELGLTGLRRQAGYGLTPSMKARFILRMACSFSSTMAPSGTEACHLLQDEGRASAAIAHQCVQLDNSVGVGAGWPTSVRFGANRCFDSCLRPSRLSWVMSTDRSSPHRSTDQYSCRPFQEWSLPARSDREWKRNRSTRYL
jgi:hypothetical protein